MQEQIFSSSWYRVSELRPQLRSHARIHRHVYRGKVWFVLEDVINQRVHRFTPATHAVLGLMDGFRTVGEIWELATESFGDDAPTQDEVILLLSQLHCSDVLQSDVPPDTHELFERFETAEKKQFKSRFLSPFAIKIPIFDPSKLLRQIEPIMRPLAGRIGVAIWLAVVLPAIGLVGMHWSELTEGVIDRLLSPQNLVLIWLMFPVVKLLHEFAHGIAAHIFGAEVHDMGIMLLVFTPVPYVDASSASAFPQRHRRALVAAAGILAEVFIAALAFFIWEASQPGVVRTLAYNTMLIAGITTLTFNANPLLRFDGYYILSDLIEVPNLRQRSNAYLGYLVERYVFGSPDTIELDVDSRERIWLVAFAIAAFVYRMFIIAFILLFVLELSLVLGTILALVSAVGWIVMPATKALRHLVSDPRLHVVRGRAVGISAGLVACMLLAVSAWPLPHRTQVEGVVWMPDEALVRVSTAGFIERVLVEQGELVSIGDPLFECRNPDLEAYVAVLEPRLPALRVKEQRAALENLAEARMFREQIEHLEKRIGRAKERLLGLTIRSGAEGYFSAPDPQEMLGRFVDQGALLAYVLDRQTVRVRAVVPQERIELVLERLESVHVRLAERIRDVLPASLTRVVPAAHSQLPSVALGSSGGGALAVDPTEKGGSLALASLFEVDLEFQSPADRVTAGGRVYVRFDHGVEPLISRWYRSVRQLFLARLDV